MFNTFLFLLYFKEKIDLYQGTQLVLLNVNSRNSSNHELSVYQLNSTNQSLFQFIISNKLLDLIWKYFLRCRYTARNMFIRIDW